MPPLKPLFTHFDELVGLLDRGVAILTPNRRLSRAVRDAEKRWRESMGQGAWDGSTVMPLRQFWAEQWRRAVTRGLLEPVLLLDAQAQKLLWLQLIREDGEQPFSLLSPERAAALCQEACERLDLWQLDVESPALLQAFGFDEDANVFLRWRRRFYAALEARSAITPEQALTQLLACPAALDTAVALLHVDELPPLLAKLCESSPEFITLSPGGPAAASPVLRPFADPRAELQAAACWCREQYKADPGGRYAVVLADMRNDRDRLEHYLRLEFDCLTSDYESLPVNFATGFPLDRVPLVRDALGILSLSTQSVDVEAFIGLLHSRFIAPLKLQPEKREAVVARLRDLARERIPASVLRSVLQGALGEESSAPPWERAFLIETRERLRQRTRAPSQWLEPMRQLLAAWSWPLGLALDSLEYQQSVQWQEACDRFAALDILSGELDFSDALTQLRELLGNEQFQPRTDDRAIQVLGPLETTGLGFDAMWVTGMSAGQWPAAAQPNPYIPKRVQREMQMPHADATWEWRWAQTRWGHWLHATPCLQASFVNQIDGAETLPSPLLEEAQTHATQEWAADARWVEQGDGAAFDYPTAQHMPLATDPGAAASFSAAVLEQQSLCPFQAFAAQRLRAAPPSATTAGLLASERGTLLHRVLYQVWGEIKDSAGLQKLDAAARRRLLVAAQDYATRGLDRDRLDLLGEDVLRLEFERLEKLGLAWLELEAQRAEAFTVRAREEPRETELAGLPLRVRLDRVDRMQDNRELIIDYKSGAPDSLARWFEERPGRPQLPLYALLEPLADAVAYATLKPGQQGFRGIGERAFAEGIVRPGDQDEESPSMASLRERWQHELELLAREFSEGVNAVDPSIDACRYCQRFALCRLDEVQA